MNYYDFLPAASIQIVSSGKITSRKKALETLADMLAGNNRKLNHQLVFRHLIEREKLSTTALGNGIAIPHCRIPDISTPQAALLCITPGIDYDAPDQIPVTMLFALLVPENAIDEHLQILASLAEILNDADTRKTLQQAADANQILTILQA